MQIFYAPGIEGDRWILDEKESRHCVRVLRMKAGTPVKLIDGLGNLYEGMIDRADPKACEIKIESVIKDFEKRNYRLHVAISPLKNPERFEWFVEKAVEIGVDEITPVICKFSEKQRVKPDRINNIIISAMKQSIKAGVTLLNEPVPLGNFLKSDLPTKRIIAHCYPEIDRTRIDMEYTKGENAVILIGPEGDFSEEEIRIAIASGFKPVHFGRSRLRTETAGIAACYSIYFLNQ